MQLIVGLGNPGLKYRETRHNVGFEVIDEVARRRALAFTSAPTDAVMARSREATAQVILAKPLTFMNRSGQAVADLSRYYRIPLDHVLIVAEDVNLPLGRLRARARGTDGGHNGFKSVIEALGTDEVSRLRVGVGRGDPRRDLGAHVLARFDADEQDAIAAAIGRAADAVDTFIADGIVHVMNRFNSDTTDAEDAEHE